MLKILEKKSPKKTLQIFWKQLEGLATDFAHSYQFNIFFRTKVRVMGLELMFLFGLLAGLYFIANYRFAGMTQPLIEVVAVNSIGVSGWTIVLIVLAFLSAAVIFGYVIAYIALKPTRDALSSQKQFIGNIAHELRTPLSVIKTNIEVAMLEGRMDARMREFMSDNIDELDRSSDIINNLLSFNTLQNPELIKFENTDLGQIVTKVLKKLAALADSKRITLSFEKGEFLTVWGNASALEQVTMNIIKNAIFYTSEGGAVHISVTPNYRGHIELCVTDNGLGIAQDTLLRVFEPFYRAEKSRGKKTRW